MKTALRVLFSLVILLGFSAAGWWAACIVCLAHDSSPPGTLYERISPWGDYGIMAVFVAAGLLASWRVFLRPQHGAAAWVMFSFAAVVLLLLGMMYVG